MSVNELKSALKQLLQDTDYAVLSDVLIDNKDDFLAFRTTVRGFLLNEEILSEVVGAGINPIDHLIIPDPVWTTAE